MKLFSSLRRPGKAPHLASGRRAEREARLYLEQHGLRTIMCNYRCRDGEIDLIMHDGRYLVFVEVRYLDARGYARPEETVDAVKQQRLIKTAERFLIGHHRYHDCPCRFDIVALQGFDNPPRWLCNAFHAE